MATEPAQWYAFGDTELTLAHLPELQAIVERRNCERTHWGYKNPVAWGLSAREMHDCLRNPHYLIVTKDLASMTARIVANPVVEDDRTPMDRFRRQVEIQVSFLRWLLELPPAPKLLVSYWAVLRQPELACRIVAEFLHLQPTNEQVKRAVGRISPTGGYLTKEDEV